MESRVSVIIPNYNGGKYIKKCIDSVINQTYKNIEIIIIDDGSIDDSWERIIEIKCKRTNIVAIRQSNLNASIARNKGIDIATGKYVLFLDSDDTLFANAISDLVNNIENDRSDLAIGNFISKDLEGKIINKYEIVNRTKINYEPLSMIGTVPNPSNKLFRLDIIKKNKIYFGNVRIGQDLNLFLKYLLLCKKISLVNSNIYTWTVIRSSMSNTFNFRIFDIVESFKDVERFYSINNYKDIYNQHISALQLKHYYIQMEKQKYFKKRKERNIIVDYFKLNIKKIDLSHSINLKMYKKEYRNCKIKLKLGFLYKSHLYYYVDNIITK